MSFYFAIQNLGFENGGNLDPDYGYTIIGIF